MTREDALDAISIGFALVPAEIEQMHSMLVVAFNVPGSAGRLVQAYALALYLAGTANGLLAGEADIEVDVATLQGFADIPKLVPLLRGAADLFESVHAKASE